MTSGPPVLECHILDTGYCTASEHHLVSTGRHGVIVECHSIAALLRHPQSGWFLWDTGYAPRILDALRGFPFGLYLFVTPVTVSSRLSLVHQIRQSGVSPDDIRYIVLSHFHADHVAGLKDFPNAIPIAARDAWASVRETTGLRALSRAFVPSLMPANFERRVELIGEFTGPVVEPFGPTHDLFNDGSVLLVRLPGHARGQIGMLATTNRGPLLFAADCCWMSASIRERTLPHPLTRLVVDDWRALERTIHHVSEFADAHPEIAIIPSHCPEAFQRFVIPEAR